MFGVSRFKQRLEHYREKLGQRLSGPGLVGVVVIESVDNKLPVFEKDAVRDLTDADSVRMKRRAQLFVKLFAKPGIRTQCVVAQQSLGFLLP